MGFRIVHAADLHLDSPLTGLSRYEGAPVAEIRGATRRALENLVDLCLAEDARLLLLAGDLYDGDWRDYSTGLFFASQMARLLESSTQVLWIRGNHDAQSKITRHLRLGEHCRELSAKAPETHVLESLGVAVHGQGFFTQAVTEDLSAAYPEPIGGLLNVGLLHTALSGRRGHAPYAPCDVRSLAARGYDYWALGHVHQREVVNQAPWIVFPGNLQGRHVRESGAKGASVIRVDQGRITGVTHRALDVARFGELRVDMGDARSCSDAVELTKGAIAEQLQHAEGRLCVLRVLLVGRSAAHTELSRDAEHTLAQVHAASAELRGGDAWIESVRVATELALDREALSQRDDAIGQLLRSLTQLEHDPSTVTDLVGELSEVLRALPKELREGPDALDLDDPEVVRELCSSTARMLLPRLIEV